jgi:hypothetical protein
LGLVPPEIGFSLALYWLFRIGKPNRLDTLKRSF